MTDRAWKTGDACLALLPLPQPHARPFSVLHEADTGMNTDNRVIVAVAADRPPGRFGGRSFVATKLGSERVSPHRGANLNKRSAGFVATQGLSQK